MYARCSIVRYRAGYTSLDIPSGHYAVRRLASFSVRFATLDAPFVQDVYLDTYVNF